MNRANVSLSDTVKYSNQTFDAALTGTSNMQLLVHSAHAFNGSAAPQNIGIANSFNSNYVSNGASGNNYLIKCKEKFNLVALNVGTADSSGSTFTYKYWDGSAFSTLALVNTPFLTSTGKKGILFNSPSDWTVDDGSLFSIRIDASGTPNYAITALKVCRMLTYKENVLSKASLELSFDERPLLLQVSESLVGFFSVPDSANTMKASYRNNP